MSLPDKSITPRLLVSAKKEFLEKGFEKASINIICKNANITTGALYKRFKGKEDIFDSLVREPANKIREEFIKYNEELSRASIKERYRKSFQDESHLIVDYMYKYQDEFKLIILCSGGTKYESYFDDLIEIATIYTLNFIKDMQKEKLIKDETFSHNLIHILVNAYIKGIMEVIIHDMSIEQALEYEKKLSKFFTVGWRNLVDYKEDI